MDLPYRDGREIHALSIGGHAQRLTDADELARGEVTQIRRAAAAAA
jgi:hypothetical protein